MAAPYDRSVWNPVSQTVAPEADLTPQTREVVAPSGRTASGYPTFGAKGSDVTEIQSQLGIAADGVFGAKTLQAVKTFQESAGLLADGIVGPMTKTALDARSDASWSASTGAAVASTGSGQVGSSSSKVLLAVGAVMLLLAVMSQRK